MAYTMAMDEVLKLKSGDFEEAPVGEILGLVDFDHSHEFFAALRARMAETMTNNVAIDVSEGVLWNGHHRVAIAYELGFAEMRVDQGSECERVGYGEVV